MSSIETATGAPAAHDAGAGSVKKTGAAAKPDSLLPAPENTGKQKLQGDTIVRTNAEAFKKIAEPANHPRRTDRALSRLDEYKAVDHLLQQINSLLGAILKCVMRPDAGTNVLDAFLTRMHNFGENQTAYARQDYEAARPLIV